MLSSVEVISFNIVVNPPETCANLMHQMLWDPDAVVFDVKVIFTECFL